MIAICLTCEACQANRPGGCAGPCLCTETGKDIQEQVEKGECPRKRFTLAQLKADPASPAAARTLATVHLGRGPGTELKKLLARIGIESSPLCKCNAMAVKMDREAPQWCLDHVDEILAVMREEAARRGLPFVDRAGRWMIRRAVRNARKKVTCQRCSPDDKCCEAA